jgi:hypothetical protein
MIGSRTGRTSRAMNKTERARKRVKQREQGSEFFIGSITGSSRHEEPKTKDCPRHEEPESRSMSQGA